MKTVLAPGAPWPKLTNSPKKKKAPLASSAKRANTDKLFEQWAQKNLGGKT